MKRAPRSPFRAARRSASGRGRSPALRLVMFCIMLALFVLAYYAGNRYKNPDLPQPSSAILLQPAVQIPKFSATFSDGLPFDVNQLRQRWTLLLIGPSNAPAIQKAWRLLVRIDNRLGEHPAADKRLQSIYLSPETQQDEPASLGELQHLYQRAFYAASSTRGDVQDLLQSLEVEALSAQPFLYLISPDAQVPAVFTTDQNPANIARDISIFIQRADSRQSNPAEQTRGDS